MKSTLLFLHGNSLNQKIFHSLKETKLAEVFQLEFLDFPGHGSSKIIPSEENCSIDGLAKFTADYINFKNLKNVILVGHSLGAHVSLRVDHDEIKANVLIAAPIIDDAGDIPNCYIDFDIFPLFISNKLSEEQITNLASSLVDPERVEWIKDILKETNGTFREILGVSLANTTYKEISLIQKREVSVLIGQKDNLINRETLKGICKKENLGIKEIHNAGHLPWLGNEIEFTNHLIDWISKIK